MRRTVATFIAAGVLTFAAAAQASPISVTTTADPADAVCPGANCSLREAIASAAPGDTIQLTGSSATPSVYVLTQGAELSIAQDVTIQGNGPDATIIDGGQNTDAQSYRNRLMKVSGGTATITGLTMRNGRDDNDEYGHSGSTINFSGGGALFVAGGTAALTNVAFLSNSAGTGGAISTNSALQLTDVTFRGNGGGGFGGGVFERSGTVTGTGVTFDTNGGIGDGGAALVYGGTMDLTNSTVYGNGAASSRGGGIQNYDGTLTLLNDTFAQDLRGSLETYYGTTTAENTIIGAGFSDGSDYACVASGLTNGDGWTSSNAITTDLGNNVDEDGHCGLSAATSQSNVSAALAPLADNGGAVKTIALLHGSAALDAANAADCPLTDARGTARPQGAGCDVGSFEAVRIGDPTAVTDPASGINSYDTTLNTTINLDGEAGGYHFIWGTAPDALSNTTEESGAGVLGTDTAEQYDLMGLSPGVTYYYEAVADNATSGVTAGEVESFTTQPGPPGVQNVATDSVTDTTATLDFSIDPAGADTRYVISYGTHQDALDHQTEPVDIGSTAGYQDLHATVTGLLPGTYYHYVVSATNSQGTVPSADQTFTTQQQASGVTGSPVTVNDAGDAYECPPDPTVDWGDGSAKSTGTVSCTPDGEDGQLYSTSASHVYQTAGHFPIVIDYGGAPVNAWALITQGPQRALDVALAGTGSGSVAGAGIECPGTCSKPQPNGSSVTLTATPASGSSFSGWSGACTGSGDCVLSMGADRAVTATFTKNAPPPAPGPTPQPAPPAKPAPPVPPAVPLPLSCSRDALVLLDVHREGRKVVVAGLALPKYAGRTVVIRPSARKAPGGQATVQDDGTFQAELRAPSRRLSRGIRYTASIGKQRSVALKLVRKLLITSEKPVAAGLKVSGILTTGRKGATITVTQQLTCHHRKIFRVIKARKGGRFTVTLPRPTGSDDLAFYRLDATAGRGKTDSLPVAVRAG